MWEKCNIRATCVVKIELLDEWKYENSISDKRVEVNWITFAWHNYVITGA